LAVEAYSPSSLPAVTAVEVIALVGEWRRDRVEAMFGVVPAGLAVRVEGPAAERIADLWRRLPPGRQARCHLPPYGLRFLVGREVVCQASVCWRCNNVYGEAAGRPLHYEFDADDAASQELLAELQRVVPMVGEDSAEVPDAPDRGDSR
jgi:hypothetical protein